MPYTAKIAKAAGRLGVALTRYASHLRNDPNYSKGRRVEEVTSWCHPYRSDFRPPTTSVAVVSFAAVPPAVHVSQVDSNRVIVGGVTTANFPQPARSFRRSASGRFSFLV
jgi:hypothetical protein